MESLDSEPCFMDDLLNFSSDMDEDDEEDRPERAPASSSLEPNGPLGPPDTVRPFHELEEELEWISNKDAFPEVESFVGILSDHQPSAAAASKHHSPVSVLDGSTITVMSATHYSHSNSSSSSGSGSAATLTSCFSGLKAPRRARSKRRSGRRRGDITGRQLCLSHQASNSKTSNCNANANANAKADKPAKKKASPSAAAGAATAATTGRKCQHCGAEKTPQWRAGPYGPKTLCNACGVRYKSGRLVPEYRPASSPSFSSELHSNSHRKILEMRRVKQIMGMVVKHPLESG